MISRAFVLAAPTFGLANGRRRLDVRHHSMLEIYEIVVGIEVTAGVSAAVI
jgi:hypothetical protein